jgi:hypothetical protein
VVIFEGHGNPFFGSGIRTTPASLLMTNQQKRCHLMQAELKTFLSLNKGKHENIDNYFNKLSFKSIDVMIHCIHPISFRRIYFPFLINLQGKERKVFLAQTTASPERQPP